MGATTRREPVRNTIPKAKAYQYYNMLDFKGIEISDNPFNTTTGSCSDCLNVYVDKEGSLTTRPRLEIMSELKNIVALQNATFIGVYGLVEGYLIHCIINNANKFYRYVNNTLTAITDTNNLCPATRCKTFEQNDVIYILTGNNYLNIIGNDLSEVEGYIPTAKVSNKDNVEGVNLEDYNILTTKYYKEFEWDFESSFNIEENVILQSKHINTAKTTAYINYDINQDVWVKPLKFFYDDSFVGFVYSDATQTEIDLYYVYYRKNEDGTRTRRTIPITLPWVSNDRPLTLDNLEIKVSWTGKTGCFVHKFVMSDILYSNVSRYDFENVIDATESVTAKTLVTGYDSANKLNYVSKAFAAFYEPDASWIDLLRGDAGQNDSFNVTFTNFKVLYTIIDDDNENVLVILKNVNTDNIYCYNITISYIASIMPQAVISENEVLTAGVKITNVYPLENVLGYHNLRYSYTKKSLVFSKFVLNTANGTVKDLRLASPFAEFIYSDIETGLYVIPYTNPSTQSLTDTTIKVLMFPNIFQYPDSNIIVDLSNVKTTENTQINKILTEGTTTDLRWIANYSPSNKEFNVSAFILNKTTETNYTPMHVNLKINENATLSKLLTLQQSDYNLYLKWLERRQTFLKSLITSRFFNQRWFTSGSHIFYTNNNDPTYIPVYNYDLLGDDGYEVTGLNVISDTGMVAYTSKQLSIITPVKDRGDGNWDYSFTETKNTTGNVAKGNTIVTSYSTLPLQIDYKGIFTIQQTENVVSEANVVTPITNAIMRKWMEESETSRVMIENTRTMNYLYWTYFLLDTGTNTKIYVLDNRTLSWFYWEIPIRVMDMYVEDEEAVFFDYNGVKYVMKTEDINEHNNNEYNLRTYYDELPETNDIIHWHWYSQILPLGSINFSKQLVATTFILNDDENTDNYGLRYRFRGFRKTIYETDNRDIEGDLQYVRNKTVRSMFTRIQFLQILLSDKTDDLIGDYSRLRLVGLGFKYRLLEANRT